MKKARKFHVYVPTRKLPLCGYTGITPRYIDLDPNNIDFIVNGNWDDPAVTWHRSYCKTCEKAFKAGI